MTAVVPRFRIGYGFDAHRLVENRKLVIGGVEIPFERGALGHSDADVLAHAVADAILGAAALGELGALYPDTDARYEGVDSFFLLRDAYARVQAAGFVIGNIDATVVVQAPRLAHHLPAMRERFADALSLSLDAVSVKAKSTEKMGYTGDGTGIAAHAAVLLVERITL